MEMDKLRYNPTTHVITHTISDEQIQNGSELIIHYQEQPYEFEGEEEGLFVYQNGNEQIKIDPTTSAITFTFPNEQDELVEMPLDKEKLMISI